MPKAIKRKAVKKQAVKKTEGTMLSEVREFASKNRKTIAIITIAFLIAVFSVAGFLLWRKNVGGKASLLEYEGYKLYSNTRLKEPLSDSERYEKALSAFKKAYSLGESPYSLYYIGASYERSGKPDDAMKTFGELNKTFPDDAVFIPLAYYKMAMISLRQGKTDEALKYLDVIYKYKTDSYKDLALVESARILDSTGKSDEAKGKYETLKKDFPNSPYIRLAESKLGKKEAEGKTGGERKP
jgi:tetratricopeptide (TPR) repeat protein